MPEEEENIFEAKAIGTYNLLREDIALRLIQCINWAKLIYRKVVAFEADLPLYVPKFLEELYGLVNATVEFIKGKEEREAIKAEIANLPVLDLDEKAEKKLEELKPDERAYLKQWFIAKKALKFFDEYKTKLKVCGLYDLRKFDVRPEYAYRKSL